MESRRTGPFRAFFLGIVIAQAMQGGPLVGSCDGEALLAAIFAEPADHTARLVYADWLEEHGDRDRAELIRVQSQLADLRDTYGRKHFRGRWILQSPPSEVLDYRALEAREVRLLEAGTGQWNTTQPLTPNYRMVANGPLGELRETHGNAGAWTNPARLTMVRGFLSHLWFITDVTATENSLDVLMRTNPISHLSIDFGGSRDIQDIHRGGQWIRVYPPLPHLPDSSRVYEIELNNISVHWFIHFFTQTYRLPYRPRVVRMTINPASTHRRWSWFVEHLTTAYDSMARLHFLRWVGGLDGERYRPRPGVLRPGDNLGSADNSILSHDEFIEWATTVSVPGVSITSPERGALVVEFEKASAALKSLNLIKKVRERITPRSKDHFGVALPPTRLKSSSARIPTKTRHLINSLHQGACQQIVQGKLCGSKFWPDIHHIVPKSEGGTHTPSNLQTLCKAHHRMAHP